MRGSNVPKQRHWLRGSGWSGWSAAILIGSLVIVVAVLFAVQWFLLPGVAVEPAPSQAVSEPNPQEDQQVAEQPEEPQDDIAKERAALDARPDE